MKKLILLAFIGVTFINISPAQNTFTSFIIGFTNQGQTPFFSSPRSIFQISDSSYRLFATNKTNIQSNYTNAVIKIAKNGAFVSGDILNANPCYHGAGWGQMRGERRNSFLYVQSSDYCPSYPTISKIDSNGYAVWQNVHFDISGNPEQLNGDSFGLYRSNSFVIYNLNGDSLRCIPNRNYSQIKQIQNEQYVARESGCWVLLDKFLNEKSRMCDSVIGLNGSVTSYIQLKNRKFAVVTKNKCTYDPAPLNWWCNYNLYILNDKFQIESSDSISNSMNFESAFVGELADKGLLLVTPSGRSELKLTKLLNSQIVYSHIIDNTNTYKNFGIWGDSFQAYELISTFDKGLLLLINKKNGPYNNTTMLMKFDSLGNFYWPFATGEQEVQSIPHQVYPNPTSEQVTFELTEQGEYELKVTDVSGKVILETAAQNSKKITTIDWNKGVYFYTLSNKDKVAKGKILKF